MRTPDPTIGLTGPYTKAVAAQRALKERDASIREAAAQGHSHYSIAKATGLTPQGVGKIVRREPTP